jgi:hypothetical protein
VVLEPLVAAWSLAFQVRPSNLPPHITAKVLVTTLTAIGRIEANRDLIISNSDIRRATFHPPSR